jgi:hypothetical protein
LGEFKGEAANLLAFLGREAATTNLGFTTYEFSFLFFLLVKTKKFPKNIKSKLLFRIR